MKKLNSLNLALAALLTAGALTSCAEDPLPNPAPEARGNYVIAATSGSTDQANYLLQVPSLDEGSASTVGYGYETPVATAWVFYRDQYLYRLQYNQGSDGITSSYALNADGKIAARDNEYAITRFTTYGVAGRNVVTVSAGETDRTDAEGNRAEGLKFTFLHAVRETTSTTTLPGENFLGNGEYVSFAGILETGGRVFTSVVPMGLSRYGVLDGGGRWVVDASKVSQEDGGSGSGAYKTGVVPGTQYPDRAWVAIYPSTDLEASLTSPIIIGTDRMGYACGRNRSQYYQTIWAADDGDVYLFSPGYGRYTSNKYQTQGVLPSAVMRIKSGASQFDADYYYDLENLSGGQPMYRCWHVTADYFLLQMYTDGLNGMGTGTTRLAIFRGSDGHFAYVSGVPDGDLIASFGNAPYCENGVAYLPVVTTDGSLPALYRIDPASATATRGLEVNATAVSAVGKLITSRPPQS